MRSSGRAEDTTIANIFSLSYHNVCLKTVKYKSHGLGLPVNQETSTIDRPVAVMDARIIGLSFDEFRWPRPVHPGDELHLTSEILEVRPSKSRPDQGLVKVRTSTLNQNNEPVQIIVGNLLVPRRSAESR
jgi:hypothetical protein